MIIGETYTVSFDIANTSGTTVGLHKWDYLAPNTGGYDNYVLTTLTGSSHQELTFTATKEWMRFVFYFYGVNANFKIDNFVVTNNRKYTADVVSYSDYSPYGMLLQHRHGQEANSDYRYGFQGQEQDDEIKGEGNSLTTEYRQYDSRIGRWLTLDPAFKAQESPYASNGNNPIWFVDPNGADSLKFDMDGNYISGVKTDKSYVGLVVSDDGTIVQTFKFNDKTVGIIEQFAWIDANGDGDYDDDGDAVPTYNGIDLEFECKIEEVTDLAVVGAPTGKTIFSKGKFNWIRTHSSDAVNGEAGYAPLDFVGSSQDWGGDGVQSDMRIRIVEGVGYDDFDASNLLWGRSMQKVEIGIFVARAGAHANAFMYGKVQFVPEGEDIQFELGGKFTLDQLTWGGGYP